MRAFFGDLRVREREREVVAIAVRSWLLGEWSLKKQATERERQSGTEHFLSLAL